MVLQRVGLISATCTALVVGSSLATPATPNEKRVVRRLQDGAPTDEAEEEGKSLANTVNDFFFDERCERTEKDTSNLSDLSNWMSTLDPATNLAEVTLPGTHHSAAYELSTKFNPNDPEYQSIQDALQDASFGIDLPDKFIAPVVCRFALTQSLSIAEQLQAGVRYFDLRIDYDAETSSFRAFHLLFGLRVEDILVQMEDFIADHPKEIIVVEIAELLSPSATADVKQELQQIILDSFGSSLLPLTDSPMITLGDMQNAGTTVIVAVQDADINSSSELIWPTSGKIRNTFADSPDVSTMVDFNQEQLGEFATASDQFPLNKLSWILTPDSEYIKSSMLRGSLYDLAREANPLLEDFALENDGSQLGQILVLDYVETSPVFDVLGLSSQSNGVFVAESGAGRVSTFAILSFGVATICLQAFV